MNTSFNGLATSLRHIIFLALLLLLTGWLIFNLVQTIQLVVADYPQIPVADYWRIPQFWVQYKAFHFTGLWTQHNEHRILFPELTYIADMFLLRGRMYLPITVSGLCYLSTWLVLVWAAYSQKVMASPIREVALLLAGIVIVWKGCSSVIATPFQLAFTLTQIAVALSMVFLALTGETGRWKYLAATVASAVVATYSIGNGMLLWPVLVAAALFLKLSRKQLLVLAAAGAVFTGLYFVGYTFMPSLIRMNIKHPLQCVEFLSSYFSMPFGYFKPFRYGILVGGINLLLIAGCFVFAFRRGLVKSRLGVVIFGSYAFYIVSAILTTVARMDPNDPAFNAAKVYRYVTVPMVSWALLLVAILWLVSTELSARWACVLAVFFGWFVGSGFSAAGRWLEFTRIDAQNAQVTAMMLLNNVMYPDQVRQIFPDPEFVRLSYPRLIYDHKSIWARGLDKWIGSDMRKLPIGSAPVAGKITRVYPVPGGVQIFGWADSKALTEDHAILFVNSDTNKVVGFGRRPPAGMPDDISTWDSPSGLTFVGFVSLETRMDKLLVYVKAFHGKLFQPIEGPVAIPTFTTLAFRTDKPSLRAISWQMDSAWTLNGAQPGPFNGPNPDGPVYGSWSGSDARTGSIHSEPFATPTDHCIVLPVLHGLATYGQSVELRDGDSNEIIAELPMMDGRSIWERWRITVAEATHRLRITAQDQGTGPGQWVAVSTPEQCP